MCEFHKKNDFYCCVRHFRTCWYFPPLKKKSYIHSDEKCQTLANNPFPSIFSGGTGLSFQTCKQRMMDGFIGDQRDCEGFSLSVVNCEEKQTALLPVKKLQSIMDDSHPWQKNTSKPERDNGAITASFDRRFKQSLVALKCYDSEHGYQNEVQGRPQGP